MDATYRKIETIGVKAPLKIQGGHFATSHAHTNYYIDLTTIKTRANEAQDIASALVRMYLFSTVVDTIVCMEGTEVIGAFLSEELTKGGYLNTNAHKTIYVVRPEFNSNSQIIFRDNIKPMIAGKHVMILMGSIITGKALNKAMESIEYYQGILTGISSVFSVLDEMNGVRISSVYGLKDVPDYKYYDYHGCELCQKGEKIDALVNAYGISVL